MYILQATDLRFVIFVGIAVAAATPVAIIFSVVVVFVVVVVVLVPLAEENMAEGRDGEGRDVRDGGTRDGRKEMDDGRFTHLTA